MKETYLGSACLDMSPTTLVVQDKGTNRTEERSRLSPVTLIQLGATKTAKAPKDLALDEKPTSEIFGMKVDWGQVLKDVEVALTARIRDVSTLARYGKRVVKNEDTEQTTGFASMIHKENLIALLRNSGKDGLFVRQTQRANQEFMQTGSEGAGAGENCVIWMPAEHMLADSQRASADLPEFMGLACRLQWDKQVRLGVRVGPAGLQKARKRFHDQDERFNDSN